MALGYEQILNDKRYNIIVDDNADEPMAVIEDVKGNVILEFKVSEVEGIKENCIRQSNDHNTYNDLDNIVDAVHQAYIKATTQLF